MQHLIFDLSRFQQSERHFQVNPVTKKETKAISDYKKVPLLVADGIQLKESSVITSILHTHFTNGTPIKEVVEWYPAVNMGNEDTNKGTS